MGRLLILDMTLTCFMTWGIALAYVAVRNQERRYLPWAYLALGLAVLTKGPVGVVLPALIFLIWFVAQKQWRDIWQLWHPGGALILAVVVLPWYILVAWRNPDFLNYFFLQEHIQRFLAPRIHAGQPFYFYFGVLAVRFFALGFFFALGLAGVSSGIAISGGLPGPLVSAYLVWSYFPVFFLGPIQAFSLFAARITASGDAGGPGPVGKSALLVSFSAVGGGLYASGYFWRF